MTAAECIALAERQLAKDHGSMRAQVATAYALVAIAKSLDRLERPVEITVSHDPPMSGKEISRLMREQLSEGFPGEEQDR